MTIVALAALVWQVIDFLRELANARTQRSAILTQVSAWVGGIVIVALAAHAKVAAGLMLPGFAVPFGKLDFGSIILVGLVISSVASSLVDTKQAIDGRDSAAKPPLIGPPVAPVTPTT